MLNLDEANYGPEVEQAAEPVLIGLCSGGGPLPRGFALLAAEPPWASAAISAPEPCWPA